jgi:Protein of unknown function (DUF2892)
MQNVGSLDRIVRIILGLALLALVLVHPPFVAQLGGWRWVLALAGVVLLVTGLMRVCPAYLPFGISTRRRA